MDCSKPTNHMAVEVWFVRLLYLYYLLLYTYPRCFFIWTGNFTWRDPFYTPSRYSGWCLSSRRIPLSICLTKLVKNIRLIPLKRQNKVSSLFTTYSFYFKMSQDGLLSIILFLLNLKNSSFVRQGFLSLYKMFLNH